MLDFEKYIFDSDNVNLEIEQYITDKLLTVMDNETFIKLFCDRADLINYFDHLKIIKRLEKYLITGEKTIPIGNHIVNIDIESHKKVSNNYIDRIKYKPTYIKISYVKIQDILNNKATPNSLKKFIVFNLDRIKENNIINVNLKLLIFEDIFGKLNMEYV